MLSKLRSSATKKWWPLNIILVLKYVQIYDRAQMHLIFPVYTLQISFVTNLLPKKITISKLLKADDWKNVSQIFKKIDTD